MSATIERKHRRRARRGLFERLEPRLMLDIHLANINFQSAGAPIPPGYLPDTGLEFADRGNGLSYGWDRDMTDHTRDRNHPAALDQRYDTLIHMQRAGDNARWEIGVPAGSYRVHLVVGDPRDFDSVFRVNVEGALAVEGTATSTQRFFHGAVVVNVTDGRLTVSNGAGAVNNKIAFLEIYAVSPSWNIATADLTEGGTASANSTNSSMGEQPPQAFDNNRFTKFLLLQNPTPANPIHLNYDFAGAAAYTVTRYTLTSGNDFPERDPASFALQGSNNGTTWTTIDTRSGIQFSDRHETQNFLTSNVTAYAMYRLAIFESADISNDRPQLAELQLFDDTSPLPSAPGNLTAAAVSTSQVQLSWADTSTNESRFEIERKAGAGGTYAPLASAAANQTTYTDSTALAGTIYFYRVRAANLAGSSSFSPEVQATTPAPAVTVNALATTDTSPPLSGTINDATAAVQISVDGRTYPAQNVGNGTWTLADNTINPPLTAGVYEVQVSASDAGGMLGLDSTTSELTIYSTVVNRRLLYNNSRFDAISDAEGLAPDKIALLPGQTATFANYSSYSRGINGVVIDFAGLGDNVKFTATDFQFLVGNSNDTAAWIVAPAPTSVSTPTGPNGTKRAIVIWPDNAIQNKWLQIAVKANAATGLRNADIFYFGNAIGESGNSTTDALVTALDQNAARNNPRSFPNFAAIDNPYDFNRDGLVSTIDQNIARNNATTPANALQLITPAVAKPTVSINFTDTAATEEGGNNGAFTILRSGRLVEPLSVRYTIAGTATNGTDYAQLTGTLVIPVDERSATIVVAPIDDTVFEGPETAVLTLENSADYALGTPASSTVTINDADTNNPPAAPVITEPLADGTVVSGADVHMEIGPFSDPDPGQMRLNTDWEIWTVAPTPVRVWFALAATGDGDQHVHFGDGTFSGPQTGKDKLEPSTDYELRVRTRDNSGAANNTSPLAVRRFRTLPEDTPTAPGWVARQTGYRVEELPFTFPAGELPWRLPSNIAFVPEAIRGSHPNDPFFYVNELYGSIRVVTNNFTVRTYATGLLNYNPVGPISGVGENGLTGLVIDPTNGDLYVTMLYDDPNDGSSSTFPKVARLVSTDGGLTASQQTDILRMPGESMRQSHIISNISFGPDDKLYVHIGEGFDAASAQNLLRFRGKIIRSNRDGSALSDNPFYNPVDRGGDGLPDAEDYVFAYGLRNPFGGAWRDPDTTAGRLPQHYTVENGPGRDRFSLSVRSRNYLWDGSDQSMTNFNIAFSPMGMFENGADDWQPAPAPVNIAFIQQSAFNYSQFPQDKWGHAFVTNSGPTHAQGPNFAKSIQEWVLNDDGTRRVSPAGQPANPRELVSYEGAGYSTAAALAAGPDGLYFSTLYPDTDPVATNRGAKILRVVYVGTGPAPAEALTLSAAKDNGSDAHLAAVDGGVEGEHAIARNASAIDAIFAEQEEPQAGLIARNTSAASLSAASPTGNDRRANEPAALGSVFDRSLSRRRLATIDLFDALARAFGEDHQFGWRKLR